MACSYSYMMMYVRSQCGKKEEYEILNLLEFNRYIERAGWSVKGGGVWKVECGERCVESGV